MYVCIDKSDTDAVVEYFEQLKYIYPKLEGRLTVLQFQNNDLENGVLRLLIILMIFAALMMLFYYIYKTCCRLGYQYQRLDML